MLGLKEIPTADWLVVNALILFLDLSLKFSESDHR